MTSLNPRPNPYVGPRAFQTGEKIYGRDREARELLDLLIAERIVLLHSPSGAGKSSLVQAGLIPNLEADGFQVLPVVRVNQDPPATLKNTEDFNRYVFSVLLSLEEALPEGDRTPSEKLAVLGIEDYLAEHWQKVRSKESKDSDSMILILDQFEEVLTADSTDREAKHNFFSQLGTALRERNRWALFVMREDYLPALDPFVRPIPTRLSNTYRLDFLSVEAARQAIHQPAHEVGVHFSLPAVSKLINDLRLVQVQQPDGSMDVVPGPYVEPVQLQVVCNNLWRHLPADIEQITEDDITAIGNVDQSLADYYAERVASIADQVDVRERAIREWFDHQLITESGLRGQVLMGQGESEGLSNQAIYQLEDTHLIRGEKRLGATWFELAHDRLIQPVRTNNSTWFQEKLSLLQRQASLWEQQNRSEILYLREQALVEAEQWAAQHPEELSEIDQEFLENCQELRARENAAREAAERERQLKLEAAEQLAEAERRRAEEQSKAATRLRRRAYILGAVMVIAVGLAVLAFMAQTQANTNFRLANQQRSTAQSASTLAVDNALQAQANAADARAAEALANENAQRAEDSAATAQAARAVAVAQQATAEFNAQLAREQEEIARIQANLARSRELASLALSFLNDNSKLTLLLGKEAMDISDTGQALDSMLRGLQRNLSRRSERYDQFIPPQEIDIYTLASSPDGQRIAWAGPDGLIRVWNLAKQDVEYTNYMNPGITVKAMAFSPDGDTIVTGDASGSLAVWDVETGSKVINLPSNIAEVNALAVSPDGSTLAIVGKSEGVEPNVWTRHLDTGEMRSFRITRGGVEDTLTVAWSPDGKLLATGGRDRVVHIWDLQTRQEIASLDYLIEGDDLIDIYEGPVRSLAFSPNGKWLATGGEDNLGGIKDKTLLVWDTSIWNDQPPVIFEDTPNSDLNVLKFSPDGQTLVAGYDNGEIVTWNFNSKEVNETIKAHTRAVLGMDFNQFEDSLLLASGGFDKRIELNNLIALNSLDSLLTENKGNPTRLAAPADDELIIAGTNESGLVIWEVQPSSGQEDLVEVGLDVPTGKFYLSLDGSRMALIPEGDQIEVRDLSSQDIFSIPIPTVAISVTSAQGVQELIEESGVIDSLAISLDGNTLAGGYCSNRSRSNEPGSNNVIDTCTNREILIWDISTSTLLKRISTDQISQIRSLAFNPQDKNSLAVGYQDATIQFWDIEQSRRSGLPLFGLGGPVTSLAFHLDGDVMATGSENNLIALWNLSPPQLIGDPFTGSDGSVTGLAFSPDNSILFSGTNKGTITRWNIEQWKQLACELAERNLTLVEWEQFFPEDQYRATCEQYSIELEVPEPTVSPASSTPTPTP